MLAEKTDIGDIQKLSDEQIIKLNMPTGIPLAYDLNNSLKPKKSYNLGDPEEVNKAADAVANQIKSK